MNKKNYTTPEVEIEKYNLTCSVMTVSNGLEGSGEEFVGGDDWDF